VQAVAQRAVVAVERLEADRERFDIPREETTQRVSEILCVN